MPESLEALNLLLLTVSTPRKVQRDGIHLHGLRYFATTLAPYVGEAVTIRYDPRDLAEIRIYHRDEFLCRAVAPDIAAATVSMQDLQAARNERRRELRGHLHRAGDVHQRRVEQGPTVDQDCVITERQLARYPQLYSRIGFAHQYRPIDPEEVPIVLAHYWEQLGRTYDPTDPTDAESAGAITTITGGNSGSSNGS
jgi:hypothetical protein